MGLQHALAMVSKYLSLTCWMAVLISVLMSIIRNQKSHFCENLSSSSNNSLARYSISHIIRIRLWCVSMYLSTLQVGGIITVPLIVSYAANDVSITQYLISAALIVSGITTVIHVSAWPFDTMSWIGTTPVLVFGQRYMLCTSSSRHDLVFKLQCLKCIIIMWNTWTWGFSSLNDVLIWRLAGLPLTTYFLP